uniref:TMF1 regulated nuclear protein 1 n=1 Tax=Varanus komodoensis TaxID=61221 RepID=A0A8D2J8I5_VARKO
IISPLPPASPPPLSARPVIRALGAVPHCQRTAAPAVPRSRGDLGAASDEGPGPEGPPAQPSGPTRLAEARRRLLEAEGRRRLVSELEGRVQQLHRVFIEAELRMATRAESLGRLGSGVAQAELHLTAHGQRLKKTLRRYKKARPPALLASALGLGGCVPWAAWRMRRGRAGGAEPPESPFKRSLQGATAPPAPRP